MKQLFLFLLLLVMFVSMANAQHDLSLYRKTVYSAGSSDASFYPWYMYSGLVFVDARYNFDWDKTTGVFVGKSFGSDALSVVPTLGALFGPEYKGVSPQVYLMGKGETYAFTLLNQYSAGISGNNSYLYNWYEVFICKPLDWLEVGGTEQTFYEFVDGSKVQMDIGPGIRATLSNVSSSGFSMYGKVWYSVSPTDTDVSKLYFTVGTTF
ncbi:hypothetical protein HY967_04990 [Candidatus Jorgensenbacteria bacterium]|nr:hypothetical protein [Candidatus Jorgensenbacteria bacterium]